MSETTAATDEPGTPASTCGGSTCCGSTPAGPSRRQVLSWAGAGAATLVLAACGGQDTPPPPPSSGEPLVDLRDIEVGASRGVRTADGAEVIVTRVSETEALAFSAVCTHQGCTVVAEAGRLACPCHGSVFDPASGAVEKGPAPEPLPEVPVRVEDGVVVTA